MVKARMFNGDKDYNTMCEWWSKHKSRAMGKEHLPLKNGGVVIEENNIPICMGFLFDTNTKICVFEFTVCNPDATKEKREKGLDKLIETIEKLADARSYNLIYTSIGIKKFLNRLQNHGYVETQKDQSHMFKRVGE